MGFRGCNGFVILQYGQGEILLQRSKLTLGFQNGISPALCRIMLTSLI
jgi:hypothetical protein